VLDDIDLIIPEGKITAIVGASGSGKTTLMKLLLKFYKSQPGSIALGGVPLA
jgi:ATP-binding cassette subfamily B protein